MKILDFIFRRHERADAQRIWKERVTDYAQAINVHVARSRAGNGKRAGRQPAEPRVSHLIGEALKAVRTANSSGDLEGLRDQWPPAHAPFVPLLEANGQSIPVVCLLDDGSILARIGAPWEDGRTVRISGADVEPLPEIGMFGQCPNRRYFAVAGTENVVVRDGWQGDVISTCPWPTGLEGLPEDLHCVPFDTPPVATRLIPFPDGQRVLLVSVSGIFVLSATGAVRLLPDEKDIEEYAEWAPDEYPEGIPVPGLSMEHGTVSKSGRFIATGSQDRVHFIFDSELNLVGEVGPMSEYPHYALFSSDDSVIALNSCHFYNGKTRCVATDLLPGLEIPGWEEDPRAPVIDDVARVYAGVARDDEFIIGDAFGYVRAFSVDGDFRWEVFIGSSICDIDLATDSGTLVVSTYAGFISVIDLDVGKQPDHQIGIGGHAERYRWLFWKDEERPLRW